MRSPNSVKGKDVLLFNVRAEDEVLRQEECRASVLHTAPDRAMLADALAQYLVWKRWQRWLVVKGVFPEDLAYLEAIRRAAKRFGGTIVEEREYKETPGARRSDTGQLQVQRQMPVLTQGAPSYDVLIVADEREVFGPYLPFRTYDPRPVAGTAGLVATSWHPAHEQWGATQMQNRFQRLAKRFMWPVDYQAWIAVRAIGEGTTRAASAEFAPVNAHIRSKDLNLAAFKGQKVTFRPWDGQMRQPILITGPDLPVSMSPQEGFLYEEAEVDTLGVDAPEVEVQIQIEPAQSRRARERDMSGTKGIAMAMAVIGGLSFAGDALAYTVYVSNEKGNSITVIDSDTLEVKETIRVGQRPRGIMLTKDGKSLLVCASDDDTVQVVDVASSKIVGDLPSGPDPEQLNIHPSGSPVYIANEDDNLATVIDLDTREVLAEVPVGVEPEGVGISPDGKILIATSETSNMAHFIDTKSFEIVDNVLVGTRPRFAEFTRGRIAALGDVGGWRHRVGDRRQDAEDHQDHRLRDPRHQAGEHAAGRRARAEGRVKGLRRARPGQSCRGDRREEARSGAISPRRAAGLAARADA